MPWQNVLRICLTSFPAAALADPPGCSAFGNLTKWRRFAVNPITEAVAVELVKLNV